MPPPNHSSALTEPTKTTLSWSAPVVAAVATTVVASLGGALTDLGSWYAPLAKPWWQPPDYAFPIVWTSIFVLSAVAGVLAWRRAEPGRARRLLIWLFGFNGALNVAWSGLFFTLQRPDLAFFEAIGLWASVLLLMIYTWRIRQLAAALLSPYLIWVSIAVALNFEILRLNNFP